MNTTKFHGAMDTIPWYKREFFLLPILRTDIVTMAENFAVMLQSGVTVPEALDTLVDQSTGALKSVLVRVNATVCAGETLSEAIKNEKRVFDPVFVSSVRVGETSGTLAENLQHVARQLERDLEIRRHVQGAMLYPSIVIITTLSIGLALATFVLPQMADVFSSLGTELPLSTQVVIWLAEMFDLYGVIITPGFLLLLIGLFVLLRSRPMQPLVDTFTLKVPGVNTFLHDLNLARFSRSLGTMLKSGVPIQEALEITSVVLSNYLYRESVKTMHEKIASGENFSKLVAEYPRLYPKIIQRMIAVGERSGGMSDTLEYMARHYEQKVEIRAKNLSTIVEPILLLVIGLAVAFLAIAIFTPIYSITEGLSL